MYDLCENPSHQLFMIDTLKGISNLILLPSFAICVVDTSGNCLFTTSVSYTSGKNSDNYVICHQNQ
jgi:hypothetical protein